MNYPLGCTYLISKANEIPEILNILHALYFIYNSKSFPIFFFLNLTINSIFSPITLLLLFFFYNHILLHLQYIIHTIYYILSLYIYIIIRHKYYRIFHWKYFIGIKEISSEFGYQHRRSPIHRSNSNIKLIATLLSTTRATYLNSTIRLETTATPLPPLPSAFTCLSDACNSTAIEIADLEPEPAYIV